NRFQVEWLDLNHFNFPPARGLLGERPILRYLEYSARTEPLRLRRRRIFQCYAWDDRHSPVRDKNGAGPRRRATDELPARWVPVNCRSISQKFFTDYDAAAK